MHGGGLASPTVELARPLLVSLPEMIVFDHGAKISDRWKKGAKLVVYDPTERGKNQGEVKYFGGEILWG